ncbi:heterokaryon incompatibility protein-domain-containing protein [Echria macrotheca]|uniref:Heterokaryon incompatibility protein-domain-containing protein n=1 Tax=Echria macrotheca TaxID=438768 RepID=A0AAJ0BMI6_9PEZI|nr:heterokaryon incompatibility protein-domain-containing protein [Echria macrotheca]
MRLLNAHSGLMSDFVSDDAIPDYAILSHTWASDEEVSFRQWENRTTSDISHRSGFVKIKNFCTLAASHGFQWVWVDTCCIDKTSSAELTEAINAMFRWYQNATTCYVYLADIQTHSARENLSSSRWFTRGWTLQELIAPKDVRFYSATWDFIDTKANLCDLISSVTNIDTHILTGGEIETVSVARRMSWASGRKTSRVEDIAYCLLGIFDINLPLIYGEGRKAFQRLQEAIMLKTPDQSLFAWGKPVTEPSDIITDDQFIGIDPIPWKSPAERLPLLGLFADGPEQFQSSREIEPLVHPFSHELRRTNPPALVSGGVLLGLVTTASLFKSALHLDQPALSFPVQIYVVLLMCSTKGLRGKLVGLFLRKWGEGYAARSPEWGLFDAKISGKLFRPMIQQWHVAKEPTFQLSNGDIIYRRFSSHVESPTSLIGTVDRITLGDLPVFRVAPMGLYNEHSIVHYFELTPSEGVAVEFGRSPGSAGLIGSFVVGVFPIEFWDPVTQSETHHTRVRPIKRDQSLCHLQVTAMACEYVVLEREGYPKIYIRVEKKPLGNRDSEVVVVDFFLGEEGPMADRAKNIITQGCR